MVFGVGHIISGLLRCGWLAALCAFIGGLLWMIRVGMNGVGCGAACVSLDVVVGGWLEFAALYSFAGSGDCAWSSSRYLVGLHIATPAVLAGLWEVTAGLKALHSTSAAPGGALWLLLLVVGVLWFGSWTVLSQLPSIRKDVASDAVFIARLEQQGVRTFYADYGPATI